LPETRPRARHLRGQIVADTAHAVRCEETGHEPVHYVPERDVRLALMRPTEHHTYCPFKGDCSYWTIESTAASSARRSRLGLPRTV